MRTSRFTFKKLSLCLACSALLCAPLYAASIGFLPQSNNTVNLINLSDSSSAGSPISLSATPIAWENSLDAKYSYVLLNNGTLQVIDLNTKSISNSVALGITPIGMTRNHQTLYILSNNNKVLPVSLANSSAPIVGSSIAVSGTAKAIASSPTGQFIYIAATQFTAGTPAVPAVAESSGVAAVAAIPAKPAYYGQIQSINISNPASPVLGTPIKMLYAPTHITASPLDNYVYISAEKSTGQLQEIGGASLVDYPVYVLRVSDQRLWSTTTNTTMPILNQDWRFTSPNSVSLLSVSPDANRLFISTDNNREFMQIPVPQSAGDEADFNFESIRSVILNSNATAWAFLAGTQTLWINLADQTVVSGNLLTDTFNNTLTGVSANGLHLVETDKNVAFSNTEYRISEGVGMAKIILTRTGDVTQAASVRVISSSGTDNTYATVGEDYSAINQTVNFAAGEHNASISLPILEDTLHGGEERLILTLSEANGFSLPSTPSVTVYIEDNDSDPRGSGGCTSQKNTGFDPSLFVLLASALAYFGWRKTSKDS